MAENIMDWLKPSKPAEPTVAIATPDPPSQRPECVRGHFGDFYNCIATHRLLCPDELQEQCRASSSNKEIAGTSVPIPTETPTPVPSSTPTSVPTPIPAKEEPKPEPPKIPKVRLRFGSARDFINILNAIKTITDEVPFKVTGNGVEVMVMDPSHVAMLDLVMLQSCFEDYEWEKPWTIWVEVDQVMRTLPKPKSNDDSLTIETVPDHDKVRWTVRTGDLNRAVTFPSLEISEEECPRVKIDFKASFRLTVEALKTIVEDACKCCENIRIEATPEEVRFIAAGDQEYAVKLDRATCDLLALEVTEPCKATYSLAYLSKVVPAAEKISEVVSLSIANSMPLKLDVEIPQISLSYYLAPYIE